jgi:hypothetical protein
VTINFFRMVSLASQPASNLGNQGLHCIWRLPYQELTLPPA